MYAFAPTTETTPRLAREFSLASGLNFIPRPQIPVRRAMPVMKAAARGLVPQKRCLPCARSFSVSRISRQTLVESSDPSPPPLRRFEDPNLVMNRKEERRLLARGISPIGSRRRRVAIVTTNNIPFEQLPYQCFQEARKVLQADREVKLKQIEVMRKRIATAEKMDPARCGGEVGKKGKLVAMRKELEKLKILADINDPMIKKRFEDGQGTFPSSSPLLARRATLTTSQAT